MNGGVKKFQKSVWVSFLPSRTILVSKIKKINNENENENPPRTSQIWKK
jgi:hypothetical protein